MVAVVFYLIFALLMLAAIILPRYFDDDAKSE